MIKMIKLAMMIWMMIIMLLFSLNMCRRPHCLEKYDQDDQYGHDDLDDDHHE